MSTTLLHTLLQVSGSGGPRMRVESSSQPLIKYSAPSPPPAPAWAPAGFQPGALRLECAWCGRKSEEDVAKIKGQESGRWAGGRAVGHLRMWL